MPIISCKMSPVRGKCSVIDITFTVRRLLRVDGRFRMFYRYTGGFRPYLLDFTFDGCEICNKKSPIWNNKVGIIVIKGMQDIYGSLFTGYPYEGQYNSSKRFDLNKTISPLLPPVMPNGIFRFMFEFLAAPNGTDFHHLISVIANVQFKATKDFRATDFSLLNMG